MTNKIRWTREFDGGQFTATRPDGRPVRIILKDSGGKFAYMRRYTVIVGESHAGDRRMLKDAKDLAARWLDR